MKGIFIRLTLLIELLLTLSFFTAIIVPRSSSFEHLSRDYLRNNQYCNTDTDAEEHQKTKDCQTFYYKTVDDPVALFTAALFIATLALFAITLGLFWAATQGSRDAERLFIQDQRPWIHADWKPADYAIINKKDIIIHFDLMIKNIGKSPAYEVTRSWLFLHPDMNTLQEYFKRICSEIPARMRYHGETVLPGQEVIRNDLVLQIFEAQIEASRESQCLGTGYIACSIMFRSNLTGLIHEISRLFMLNIAGGCPLHRVHDCNASGIDLAVSLISMPVFNKTT